MICVEKHKSCGNTLFRDDEGDTCMTKCTLLEEDHLQKLAVLGKKASLQDLQSSLMLPHSFPRDGPLTSALYDLLFLE